MQNFQIHVSKQHKKLLQYIELINTRNFILNKNSPKKYMLQR